MVNDSIADEVQRIHKLATRPLVVRNIPPYGKLDMSIVQERRQMLMQLVGAQRIEKEAEGHFFAMYHGAIVQNRGVEIFIKAVAANPDVIGIIMGYAMDEEYMSNLMGLADMLIKEKRMVFLPSVPFEELFGYVGAADVGVILVQNTCKSYFFSLPNKIFENIQSLTPVIVSDFREMKSIVEGYEIGLACDETSVDSINACLNSLRTDKELYNCFKENLIKAKDDLCWEKEKLVLVEAYRNLKSETRG